MLMPCYLTHNHQVHSRSLTYPLTQPTLLANAPHKHVEEIRYVIPFERETPSPPDLLIPYSLHTKNH